MLEKYKNEQPVIYETLVNELSNNTVSHAYLFDVSNYSNAYAFVIAYIKSIFCVNHFYIKHDKCNNCNLCKTIDDMNYPDFKIINPEGQWIKKNQLDELQYDFSTKSLYNNKKIYLLNGADHLNNISANSILKFLEEPSPNIVAILLTSNINNVLDTIKSRCQVFTFSSLSDSKSGSEKIIDFFSTNSDICNIINIDNVNEYMEQTLKFMSYLEHYSYDAMTYIKKLWFEKFDDKPKNILGLNLLLLGYKDVVNYKINRNVDFYSEYNDILKFVSDNNEMSELYKKINKISDALEKNKVNININLNMDYLIMDMEDYYD